MDNFMSFRSAPGAPMVVHTYYKSQREVFFSFLQNFKGQIRVAHRDNQGNPTEFSPFDSIKNTEKRYPWILLDTIQTLRSAQFKYNCALNPAVFSLGKYMCLKDLSLLSWQVKNRYGIKMKSNVFPEFYQGFQRLFNAKL